MERKYWVYGVARKLGFGENSVWSPRLGSRGVISNMLEGWIEDAARTEDAKRPRIDGEAEIERREGFGEGARWAPPRKNFENSYLKPCILEYISWSENLNFRPADIFPRFSNDFDTFQSNAYLGVEESPFSKTCTWWSKWTPTQSRCPDFKRGFNCVVYTPNIYSVEPPILDPRLEQLVGSTII